MNIATNPSPEVETTTTAQNPVQAVENDQAESQDAELQDGQNPEEIAEESEEIEEEGERYALPKKLAEKYKEYKGGHMKMADYTQKTQALSEERDKFQREKDVHEQDIKSYAELHAIDKQLEEYKKLDWKTLGSENPAEAFALDREMQALREGREKLAQEIKARRDERALEQQRKDAKRYQEGTAQLQRDIKGWSPELARNIADYGVKSGGFSEGEMSALLDPRQVKILHKAYLYDQLVKKQAQKSSAMPEAKPVPKVGGKNPIAKDPANMSDKEFAEMRRKQIAQRH